MGLELNVASSQCRLLKIHQTTPPRNSTTFSSWGGEGRLYNLNDLVCIGLAFSQVSISVSSPEQDPPSFGGPNGVFGDPRPTVREAARPTVRVARGSGTESPDMVRVPRERGGLPEDESTGAGRPFKGGGLKAATVRSPRFTTEVFVFVVCVFLFFPELSKLVSEEDACGPLGR